MIKNHQRNIAELENAISKLKISRGVQQQTRSSRNRDQWIQSSLKSHWVREAKKEWKKKKWLLAKALMGHHQNDQYICYGSLRRRERERNRKLNQINNAENVLNLGKEIDILIQ